MRSAGAHADGAMRAQSPTSRASLFPSSSASDFVTGTAIPIDGGFSVMGRRKPG
jgi:NAD(P)-dependent dehydrogenase (short-subunit alcohol dehydrogenase family)